MLREELARICEIPSLHFTRCRAWTKSWRQFIQVWTTLYIRTNARRFLKSKLKAFYEIIFFHGEGIWDSLIENVSLEWTQRKTRMHALMNASFLFKYISWTNAPLSNMWIKWEGFLFVSCDSVSSRLHVGIHILYHYWNNYYSFINCHWSHIFKECF